MRIGTRYMEYVDKNLLSKEAVRLKFSVDCQITTAKRTLVFPQSELEDWLNMLKYDWIWQTIVWVLFAQLRPDRYMSA